MIIKFSVQYNLRKSHVKGSDCLFYHTANCLFSEGSKSPLIGSHMHVFRDGNSNPPKPPLWPDIKLKKKQKTSIQLNCQISGPLHHGSCLCVR